MFDETENSAEIPHKIEFYSGLIKKQVDEMLRRLERAENPECVAMSMRDFMTATNAHRDNEEHHFMNAWRVIQPVYLAKYIVKKANGRQYDK